jgi:FtsP/CotA-like multicopper oxidase with cupredoxin domain
MDGAPGMTQPPVETGGKFRYEFVMRDAGTDWYHPHMNSSAQVGRGLYGPIVVNDPADSEVFGDELVLVLSDMGIRETGELVPLDTGGSFGDLFGREGSVVLVNGKVNPRLKVRSGKQQRWRVINAARSRYFDLRLREHGFVRIGGDNGLAAASSAADHVLVTPGERADIVFTPSDAPGTERVMYWLPPDRGYGTQTGRGRDPLLVLETVDLPPVVPAAIPTELRAIPAIDLANAVTKTLELTIEIDRGAVVMGINGVPYERAKPLHAKIGETHVWRVVNGTDFAHPFHLHGYFFQVLGAAVPEWKDTVNVPPHSDLELAVHFDERPGMWMYHCHILDHAEVGMMGHLHVAK